MEQKLIRKVAVFLLLFTIMASAGLYYLPTLHSRELSISQKESSQEKSGRHSVLNLMWDVSQLPQENNEMTVEGRLRLELPEHIKTEDIIFENQYVDNTIEIVIPQISQSYFKDYPMVGDNSKISDIIFDCQKGRGVIDIITKGVYELQTEVSGSYLYLDFVAPRELYDKVVVVDAGHGGDDGGSVKGDVREKDIDLAIALQLREIFAAAGENIGVYYTRIDDSNPSPEQRVSLANDIQADLFLSIHNNSTASGRMSDINGTQVRYHVADKSGKSKLFAGNCLTSLVTTLQSMDKGLVAGDEDYMIRQSQVPVALVEVGFMTNQGEQDKLKSPEYQQQTAQALYHAIIKTLEEQDE